MVCFCVQIVRCFDGLDLSSFCDRWFLGLLSVAWGMKLVICQNDTTCLLKIMRQFVCHLGIGRQMIVGSLRGFSVTCMVFFWETCGWWWHDWIFSCYSALLYDKWKWPPTMVDEDWWQRWLPMARVHVHDQVFVIAMYLCVDYGGSVCIPRCAIKMVLKWRWLMISAKTRSKAGSFSLHSWQVVVDKCFILPSNPLAKSNLIFDFDHHPLLSSVIRLFLIDGLWVNCRFDVLVVFLGVVGNV